MVKEALGAAIDKILPRSLLFLIFLIIAWEFRIDVILSILHDQMVVTPRETP
jgi:hypothetical protein